MEVNVLRVNKTSSDKGGLLGFANVEIKLDEESSIVLNSLSIRKIVKDGDEKIICSVQRQKNEKDGKYYDRDVSVRGPFWWQISNAVINAYNGESVPKKTEEAGGTEEVNNIAILKNQSTTESTKRFSNPFRGSI